MKRSVLFLLSMLFALIFNAQTIFINEFHYDNEGTDTNEFVEVVVPVAITDISNIKVSLYNGATGKKYAGETSLTNYTLGSTSNGHKYYYKDYSSIQNGPDAIFIKYYTNGDYLFLSYEGSFMATDGPASSLTSTDIGLAESDPGTPINSSLYLAGTGSEYSDFTWAVSFGTNTKGTANNGQNLLPITLTNFTAQSLDQTVQLSWSTASEKDNDFFTIERSADAEHFSPIGTVKGSGSVSTQHDYTFTDAQAPEGNNYYRLRQTDFNGAYTFSSIRQVFISQMALSLQSIGPNPVNNHLLLSYQTKNKLPLQIQIFDTYGSTVLETTDAGYTGSHQLDLDMHELAKGIYWIQITNGNDRMAIPVLKN